MQKCCREGLRPERPLLVRNERPTGLARGLVLLRGVTGIFSPLFVLV